jgi:peptide/nickel transport system permease protein
MARFIARRLGFTLMTVFLASIIIFWATAVLPGDVASQILGRFATEEAKSNLRTELGLDRPVVVQYTTWLGDYVQGDWGESPSMNSPVRPIVSERLRN